MKLLVFSDTHGKTVGMRGAMELHRADTDGIIFLGDGIREAAELCAQYADIPFYAVRGNCDAFSLNAGGVPLSRTVEVGEHTLFLSHGHMWSVGGGVERYRRIAQANGADIALHGHTHVAAEFYFPEEENTPPAWVFCPGSIGNPRDGAPSYGILSLLGKNVLWSCVRME